MEFDAATVAGVTAHMNADHLEDSLLIVRTLGECADATGASVSGIGPDGVEFEVVGGATTTVTIPWAGPVEDRVAIRHELVRMVEEGTARSVAEPAQRHEM